MYIWFKNGIVYCLAVLLTFGPAKIPVYTHICQMADSITVSMWAAYCTDLETVGNNDDTNTKTDARPAARSCCQNKASTHCGSAMQSANASSHNIEKDSCCQTYTKFVGISGNFLLQSFSFHLSDVVWQLLPIQLPTITWVAAPPFFHSSKLTGSFCSNKAPPLSGRAVLILLQTFRC